MIFSSTDFSFKSFSILLISFLIVGCDKVSVFVKFCTLNRWRVFFKMLPIMAIDAKKFQILKIQCVICIIKPYIVQIFFVVDDFGIGLSASFTNSELACFVHIFCSFPLRGIIKLFCFFCVCFHFAKEIRGRGTAPEIDLYLECCIVMKF